MDVRAVGWRIAEAGVRTNTARWRFYIACGSRYHNQGPECYYRAYLKSQTGWKSGTNSNQSKFTRATSFVAANWSQAMIAHLWSNDTGNNNYLRSDPASCVSGSTVQCVGYNDFAHINWLGG